MNDEQQKKKKRPRSPSYPVIDLGVAVQRAEAIYKHDGKYFAPIDTILSHWGYSARGGRALRQVAALKKFGLIEEEGSQSERQLKLSQLGLYIVMPDSPERAESLKKAAMLPTIHKELRNKYSEGLPSDSNVRWYLKSERGFTEKAAAELLAEYRATMRFAGLDATPNSGDTVKDTDDRSTDEGEGQDVDMTDIGAETPLQDYPKPTGPGSAEMRGVTIPLPGTAWVKIAGEFPMAEDSWEQMMTMLAAMKPGLTRTDD